MELSDYLRIVRRSWRLVVAVLLATVAVAALLTAITPREYRAEAELYVSTAGGSDVSDLVQGSSFTQRQVATYADIVTTPAVLGPVIDDLGLEASASGLARRVTATVPADTVLINVAVVDGDPVQAAEIANMVADQFAETVQELERVSEQGESAVKATVVQPATPSEDPASPDPLRNMALALVLGLLLGLGLAVLRDLLDRRVRGEADIARVTEEPTIGAIAFDKDAPAHPLVIEIDPHSPRAESFRALRTNLLYLDPDDQPTTFLITSSVPGEGKSTTAANLALTIAETGSTVCLIEGDLRRPRLLDYMGLENAAGVTDVVVGRVELADVLQPYVEGLYVLGCGPIPPNPSELLGSDAMRRMLERLSAEFDYVLIDGPPLLAVTDGAILSTMTDGALVVVGANVVRRDELERALGTLERVGGKVLGLVANRLATKGPDAYQYSYGNYRPDTEIEGRGRRPRSRKARRQKQTQPQTPVAQG
ncbi:polysaccharide biosynthesis tyrosine autokinase [Ornithinimicrobium kibberense]|uniref:Polysaccharide biosynthesis tyrosine autokinase n=1 Tax=Ornithinimicrobium kibberense TaxID=282060 RepID=A0ABV5V6F3_9MICO|nr:polysaccharide biosynthesis tyrosine autokinase [Ornithinimicrobium kibberense]